MTAPEGIPETGEITLARPDEVVDIVEEVADDLLLARTPLLIVLDIDGTVLLEDESLSPGIVDAVSDAQDAGHRVMLATGRAWENTRGILRVLGIAPEYVVCSNGAVILQVAAADEHRYERVHTEEFDATEVLTLLRVHLPDAKYMVELPDGSRLYTEFIDDWNLLGARRVTFEELTGQPVSRVVVVSPDDTDKDFLELISRIGLNEVSYAVGWSAWLDIAPQGVDKSTALELVRTWLEVPPSDILVIGDGRNDVGMFQWALDHGGRAVAMEQGPPEVRAVAGEITLSVEAGGVAEVLRRL